MENVQQNTVPHDSNHIHENKKTTPNKKIKKSKKIKVKTTTKPSDYSFSEFSRHVHAEPMIRSVWTGSFKLNHRIINGFSAYLSTKACQNVCMETMRLKEIVQFEMVKKFLIWPESFKLSGPNADNDIALFFFPSLMKNESAYDQLVFEMMNFDLALRAFVQNAELLIFTSVELPQQFWRFQGKFYLWGVFREKTGLTFC